MIYYIFSKNYILKALTCLIINISFFVSVSAQSKESKKTYVVNVNNKDYTEKVELLNIATALNPQEEKTYYWYTSNKVLATKGGYDGKLIHGQYTAFYLNNNLKEKGKFVKGLKNGVWVSWFPTGRIKEIITWRKGIKNGPFRTFDEQGKPVLNARYKNDLLEGTVQSFENEKLLSEKKYHKGVEVIVVPKEKKPKKHWLRFKKKNESEGVPVERKTTKEKMKELFKSDPEKKQKKLQERELKQKDSKQNEVVQKKEVPPTNEKKSDEKKKSKPVKSREQEQPVKKQDESTKKKKATKE